ncbi:MAG: sodium-translocating pyrophosphatase [Actinobacteria bacterium]|nr:sodium-translocating pyrophosphatase [Actinomycetota bacterium]
MPNVFAAEGGYQLFELTGSEWIWLGFSGVVAVIAVIVGLILMRSVLAQDAGTEKMGEIASAVQEGAMAYIKRQFRTILIIVVPLAVVVFVTSTEVINPLNPAEGLSRVQSGMFRTLAFLAGALFSGLIGFIGMWLATRANVRTAAAAKSGSMDAALQVAFRAGGTIGLFTAGLGLLGATVIVAVFQNTASSILVGFGFGGSLLALFLRVGGGIFTKAADVGADLVGKVEAGIPEDDARNPATIADNVGDNVGDCAGMASDLFESFGVVLVANIILGVTAFRAIGVEGANAAKGLIFPLAMMAIGLLASLVAIFAVKAKAGETDALKPINRGLNLASLIALVGAAVVAFVYVGNPAGAEVSSVGLRMFVAVVIGVVLGQVVSRITQYYTSSQFKPVRDIAESGRTGPATVVLSGISSGMESAVWAVVSIGAAILAGLILGGGNLLFAFYLVALTGIGMLSTTGIVVAEDTFGPIADNAQGIAEMSDELEGETETILDGLDTVGNTTKAVTKGFAIGSAVIAAVALFASFRETIASTRVTEVGAAFAEIDIEGAFNSVAINIADPRTFAGALIGGAVVFLFSSLAILAVGRTAGTVVQEVRRQFREKPGIMDYTEKPDYGPVIDICTGAALRELTTPAVLAVLMPVVVGFGLGKYALGGFLAATIIVGALMANFLSNAGGAWDNGKKYIEEGHLGGKGSEVHKAVVIGDTVGDPFKDTAGPAINPLIKVMNLVALLILPAIIALETERWVRYGVAGVAALIVLGSVIYSKQQATSFGDDASADGEIPESAEA